MFIPAVAIAEPMGTSGACALFAAGGGAAVFTNGGSLPDQSILADEPLLILDNQLIGHEFTCDLSVRPAACEEGGPLPIDMTVITDAREGGVAVTLDGGVTTVLAPCSP